MAFILTCLGIGFAFAFGLGVFLLIPVALYFVYTVCRIVYVLGYLLITGNHPDTGKPPQPDHP
jgi:hypothetical protein